MQGVENILCGTYAVRQDTQAFNNTGVVTLIQKSPSLKVKVEGLFQENADFKLGSKVLPAQNGFEMTVSGNPSKVGAVITWSKWKDRKSVV